MDYKIGYLWCIDCQTYTDIKLTENSLKSKPCPICDRRADWYAWHDTGEIPSIDEEI